MESDYPASGLQRVPGFWVYAQDNPKRLALVDPNGKTWTRGDLLSECNRISHGLCSNGVEKGDCVAVMMHNCAEFVATYLAATQIGLHFVPINWHLVGPEIAYILSDSRAKAFLTSTELSDSARGALKLMGNAPKLRVSIGSLEGFEDYEDWVSRYPNTTPNNRIAGEVLSYTSGTTGRPKGVFRELSNSTPEQRFAVDGFSTFGIHPEDNNVFFCGTPLYHAAPLGMATASLHLGHAVVIERQWDPERMLQLFERWRVTFTQMVPTQFVRLLKLDSAVRTKYDLKSLTHAIHTGAPCARDVKWEMLKWWGPVVYEAYGSTEGYGTIATPQQWTERPGTVGKSIFDNGLRILDDCGRELPPYHHGSVYMRIPPGADFEYKGDPEQTALGRIGEYFTLGDVGYIDDEAFLFLCGRKGDMIISGGANIYPAEVEAALIMHPSIADCAVIGVPNAEWGEEVKAIVELCPGHDGSSSLTSDILRFLEGRISRMYWPKSIDYISQLPRDPNGKLMKRRLLDPYWENQAHRI